MAPRSYALAGAIAAILYLMLDSGVVRPEAAPRVVSLSLLVLSAIFGVATWTSSISGQKVRSANFAGLAIGVAGYALVRLFAF